MVSFQRILFPVDFSAQCQLAARYVTSFARHFDAKVSLLHVEVLPVQPYVWESQTVRLTQMLRAFALQEFPGLEVEQTVTTGDPAHEIVSYAHNEKSDLIMVPTHGWGPFRRFVLGSVTAKILHDTSCPVWTSAHLDVENLPTHPNLINVVCAVDLDETGVHTLRYAGNFARRTAARLTVAHAVPAIETLPEVYMDAELRADLLDAARKRLHEMMVIAECEATVCVGTGNIARFISHAAEGHEAGLVMIGRGGGGVLGRLRTHDYAIIRECKCPVLSI